MSTPDITLNILCGSDIREAIRKATEIAAQHAPAAVRFDFNGVAVAVCADSDPDLIYRDWSRALSGCIPPQVGPYPAAQLTPEEQESDARIRAENERRRKGAAEAKRKVTEAKLVTVPPMTVTDQAAWQSWKDSNADPYGSAVIRYAETWARLMESAMTGGATLEDVADATSHEADIEGVTGFMHGAAVHCLASCWVHGDQLRRWHNQQWGAPDTAGTVNPAVLTLTEQP